MKKRPNVVIEEAVADLYKWWEQRFREGGFRDVSSNSLTVDSDVLRLKLQDVVHFLGFEDVREDPRLEDVKGSPNSPAAFCVHSVSNAKNLDVLVRQAIQFVLTGDNELLRDHSSLQKIRGALTPLNKKDLETYRYVFDNPSVSIDYISFAEERYEGVRISTPLKQAYGECGKLSSNVFKYGRRVCLSPSHQVILGLKAKHAS